MTLTAYTGPSNITTPNTVIDGKTMECVTINATGVAIRNSVISCSSAYYAVNVRDNGSVLIEGSEIDCKSRNANGLGWANATLRRVEITDCENGLHVQRNITVEDSYIHDLYMGNDATPTGCSSVRREQRDDRHNTILGVGSNGALGTSALIMSLPGHSNFLIENNLFAGGAYTVYCVDPGKGTNWVIRNNRFSTRFSSKGGRFGFASRCSDET